MEKKMYNVGDICKVIVSCYTDKLGKFVTIKETCKTQALVIFPDGKEEWMGYDCLQLATIPIPSELYDKLSRLGLIPNDVRDHNVGKSDYSKHLI